MDYGLLAEKRLIMKSEELEAQVKELTAAIAKLEARVTLAEDIEAIKKLQRGYGY